MYFKVFSIIPSNKPLQPACTIPNFCFPRIIIGAQSAVKIPNNISSRSVIIESASKDLTLFCMISFTILECI